VSLLADLLSKIKHPQTKREIPPNLKNIVYTSTKRSVHKKRIIIVSALVVAFVISGVIVAHILLPLFEILDKAQEVAKVEIQTQAEKLSKEVQKDLEDLREVKNQVISKKDKPAVKEPIVKKEETKKVVKTEEKKTVKKSEVPSVQVNIDTAQRDAYLYSAREYEMRRDYSKALSLYRKVLEIDKDNITVMNNIAYILLHLGLVNESIRYSERAINIKKDYTPALINLGIAYAKLGENTAAEKYLKKAFMLEPDNETIILNLAILYERQNDYDRASRYFSKLTTLGNITGFLGLARIYEKQGRIEEALQIYRSIYSLDSMDDEVRRLVRQRISSLSGK
jgi:tetratricopeptide (TPR) repeat protein